VTRVPGIQLMAGATLAAVALLAGCAVGPDFERPPASEVGGYAREPLPAETAKADIAGGEAQRFVQIWTFRASGGRCSTPKRSTR
jgi:hypothetical protein